jgi:hypothetical protein
MRLPKSALALAAATAVWVAFLFVLNSLVAHASVSPAPTVHQAVHKLVRLTNREQILDQRYDLLTEQLTAAGKRLRSITHEEARDRARFAVERRKAVVIAAQAYEAGLTSYAGLLLSPDPQQVLDKGSILLELSSGRTDVMHQLVQAARQLRNSERAERGARAAIRHMRDRLAVERRVLVKAVADQRALLANITPREQGPVIPGGGRGGSYHGPLRTRAQHAVAFAYRQLGKPYIWGGTGPRGFDCSGLVMKAWASAGVSIPRTSEEQWAGLTHVPFSRMRPGDLLVFNGAGHVGIYVGHGFLIDAPHTGAFVEKVALAGWYISALDGVVRP